MFVGVTEARRNRRKGTALAELAARDGLILHCKHEEVVQGSPVLSMPSDAFVCAVDNPETRRILDGVNTRCLVNAGVGGRAEDAGHVLLSRHLPNEIRLSQRYAKGAAPPPSRMPPREFEDSCSRVAYDDASLATPFIGLAAGALLAAATAARALNQFPPACYFKTDMLRLQSKFHVEDARHG